MTDNGRDEKAKHQEAQEPEGPWEGIVNAATMGLHLVSATFIGFAIGWYLDKWLGTEPWMMIFWLISGIGAGFKNMFMEVRRIEQANRKNDPDRKRNDSKANAEPTTTPDNENR